ncbi:MAG: elongation factor EF-2, partial [Candidatus Micrarchaeota archaeon]
LLSENTNKVIDNSTEQVYDSKEKNLNVFSLNKENGKIEQKLVEFAWKLKGGKVLIVKLENGYTLTTTPEHKYILLENNNFIEKPACELKIGDKIACLANVLVQTNASFSSSQIVSSKVAEIQEDFEQEVYDFTVADNHNFVAQGMFVHNTTLSDTLVARAGLISKELAGEQRVLDYDEQEQARGITIKAANISIAFKYADEDYLINLIDTPGHVDFGGHVTRAMRAVDGIILVVDCVEGIMPQTETVLRQALKEKVKPVLFINKIDRFINELKLDGTAMQQRFLKIISGVNKLIDQYGPPEFKEAWEIKVESGNVAFGTAFNKWAISYPIMQTKKIGFKDIYEKCVLGSHKELQQLAPLDDVILEMVIKNLPDPMTSQKYRVPVIWHGDLNSVEGKGMMNCDSSAPACFTITAIQTDPHAGEVAIGRLYSGNIVKGSDLFVASQYKKEKVQQVAVYMGPDRILVENVPAGNIVALVGLHDVYAGETVSQVEMVPFEKIKHHSEPVVTKSIEAKNPKDLVKLVEVLHKIGKEDPTLKVEINQQTGEHLISGMGELHLEIIEYKIQKERGVAITTSPPIVVYHETVTTAGPTLDGKSPNKHNKFKLSIEPLEESVVKAFSEGEIHDKMKGKDLQERLIKAGLPRDEARKVLAVFENNLFLDVTKGVQYLQDIQELVIQAFMEAMKEGPMAKEECVRVKVKLEDASIHVDPAHRGPAQIIPAIKRPIFASFLTAKPMLLEPKQRLVVSTPSEYMSGIIAQIQGRRGQIIDMQQEGESVNLTAKVPVSEMFGFASEIRGASQGRAVWYTEYAGYEKMPAQLQNATILAIRKRKGEVEQLPTAAFFMD